MQAFYEILIESQGKNKNMQIVNESEERKKSNH